MSKYKVCVYAISKNEEKFVDKWVDSMQEADLIIVADTGSKDNTVEKLKQRGVQVEQITVDPWRFDLARNLSMDFVPGDTDICVCTDLDEVFDAGWREKLENAWSPETTRLRYSYTYGFHPDGTPIVTYLYEKIHRRNDFRWIYPVHEILEYSGSDPDTYATETSIHLKHYPDHTKSRSNYLNLLELSAKEFPLYDRNIHYLGREYLYHQKYDEAIQTLTNHLSLPTATWADERCASMRYIARCYWAKGRVQDAINWLYRAIAEAPYLREPFIELARFGYLLNNWPLVYHMVDSGLKIKKRTGTYLDEEASWGYVLYDLGAISCSHLGLYKQALSYAKLALEKKPDDERLKNNVAIIEKQLSSDSPEC